LFPYRNSGSILIIAIWILVFFSILSVGLYNIVSSQIRLTKSIQERFLCAYLAKAASIYAQTERKKDKAAYDTLYKLRQKQERQLGLGKFIYTLVDEESKININNCSAEEIGRLPGLNLELAESITRSSLRPFQLKEEIMLIEGVTEEIFKECKDFITTYSEGRVNINTASYGVLKALGLDENLVNVTEDFRRGPDNQEATEDDGVFENTGEIISKLVSFRGISQEQKVTLSQLISQGKICVASVNFSLQIEAQILDKPAMKYAIVMDTSKIKQWREE
jgi:DNA uptake protein ComE-like DNA-binding protein